MANTSERGTGITPAPEVLPASAPVEGAEAYRPMSVLAIAAFSLAAFYAFLVVLGGLVAFATRNPRWLSILCVLALLVGPLNAVLRRDSRFSQLVRLSGLSLLGMAGLLGVAGLVAFSGSTMWGLPGTLWFVPVTAIVLALFARVKIQAAEGTLDGESQARWALVLSLVFGLIYMAYLTSNTLAIRAQAQVAAEEFLTLLKQGELYEAFSRTLPLRARPTTALRPSLEIEYNTPRGPNEGGPLGIFAQTPFVRLLLQSGDSASWTLESTTDSFDRGNYQVTLKYRVQTSLATCIVYVGTIGQESSGLEVGQRRQWHIDIKTTGEDGAQRKPTAEMENIGLATESARNFFGNWCNLMRDRQLVGAFLETQPFELRSKLAGAALLDGTALLGAVGLTPVAALGTDLQTRENFQRGFENFKKGTLIDQSQFFADPNKQKEILELAREAFAPLTKVAYDVAPITSEIPLIKRRGDLLEVQYPGRISISERQQAGGRPLYRLEFEAVLVGPYRRTALPAEFTLESIRLLRGQLIQLGPPG